MVIGYTTGVYDLFHVGHLNLLKNAKGMCDKLIVGVTTDELVSYKGKKAMIPFEDRLEIVRSIKYVDAAIPQYDMDKLATCKKLGATILFVGDDWYDTDKWKEYEKQMNKEGIKIVYFPYTKGVSSTIISKALKNLKDEDKNVRGGVDKDFCISSFLTFRYIEKKGVNFFEKLNYKNEPLFPMDEKIPVSSAKEIDEQLKKIFDNIDKNEKLGILLSGGMDSAILASYMSGCDAYTFRFLGGKEFAKDELSRAEYYAKKYNLKLHYVDIDFDVVDKYVDRLMISKGAPVHSIEPQILAAAIQAKADGVTMMITGEGADCGFGGLDGLLSKDWTFDEFVKRYTYIDPKEVVNNPVDMSYLYERYRLPDNKIDFQKFIAEVVSEEASFGNAFRVAGLKTFEPYTRLKMKEPLDLNKVRNGQSKYLIRELFETKYKDMKAPNKIPMPRPVDIYFKDWKGPTRPEFKKNLDMSKFSGNQKWMLYVLERFLNLFDK